jgi:hypothetical protein
VRPEPVVVRPIRPALLPDRRADVAARLHEVRRNPDGTVTMPADLWDLAGDVNLSGWTNAAALEAAVPWWSPTPEPR